MLCNTSESGSPNCVLTRGHPLARATHGVHIPQAYFFLIGASLGSALLLSTVYIVTYYFVNIRKKTTQDKDNSEADEILSSAEEGSDGTEPISHETLLS